MGLALIWKFVSSPLGQIIMITLGALMMWGIIKLTYEAKGRAQVLKQIEEDSNEAWEKRRAIENDTDDLSNDAIRKRLRDGAEPAD